LAFRVAARTILELGAELISSDSVAIYEIVKNAIDAQSPDGVSLDLCITLPHNQYVDILADLDDAIAKKAEDEATRILASIDAAILNSAPPTRRQSFLKELEGVTTLEEIRTGLQRGYESNNWIEFRDSGHGMSRKDLLEAYLLIGTPARRTQVNSALVSGEKSPYLGEKGVGRLSAMRLGSRLKVTTARAEDTNMNILEVDWTDFEDDTKLLEDIPVAPRTGPKKPERSYQGTTIHVSNLQGGWSPKRIQDIAMLELSRLWDPFTARKRRFRVAIFFNGDRVDIPRLDRAILELAHATLKGKYRVQNGKASLVLEMWCGDLGKGNKPEARIDELENIDLRSITRDDVEVPKAALATVGSFDFDLYWFNRQRLKKVDTIGDRNHVLALQKQWSGIMLFRDGYRVFPYGDDQDDWLGLDRRALASPGYKLNKAQFIGRVAISRSGNRMLVDQTNREGLKDCDEKSVLIEVLYFAINDSLRKFLDEIIERQKNVQIDFEQAEKRVDRLEERATKSLKEMQRRFGSEKSRLEELKEIFEEMQKYFLEAKARAEQIEDERDRMIQLAGIGLMLESIAHELARSTEFTLKILEDADSKKLPADVHSVFNTLRSEMKTMNRRLRVLDPLSISGRQRKENFDFVALVRDVLAGHARQFQRHKIETVISSKHKSVLVHGVKGMFVQIVENLINNSVYWMDLRAEEEPKYQAKIEIKVGNAENLMEYTDNGPGIQPSMRDEVFKAFFSTKGKSRRQGLGLYIARDCAMHHGGSLYLSEDRSVHRGRLNTFVLELPPETK
jgi:signal transduction histidine kinase